MAKEKKEHTILSGGGTINSSGEIDNKEVKDIKTEYTKAFGMYLRVLKDLERAKQEVKRVETIAINIEGQLRGLQEFGNLNHDELVKEFKKEQENPTEKP